MMQKITQLNMMKQTCKNIGLVKIKLSIIKQLCKNDAKNYTVEYDETDM